MRIVSYTLLFLFLTASAVNDGRKANAAYERGDYAEAVQLYRQAIQQDPENAKLHFNLGNALYRLGQADEARESYNRFNELAESPIDQSYADYNVGRMLVDEENYEEALNYFREALKKNPADDDARFNYELALNRQQQHEEDQQQEPESGDNGDDENQQESEQNQDQDQEPEMNQQPEAPQNQDGDQEQEEQQIPLDMSPEEAENILDALEQIERELLENRKKESSTPPSRNEKDW